MRGFSEIAPVELITAAADERGRLIEPFGRELLGSGTVQHLHVIEFKPGAVRGNHVHRAQTEVIVLLAGRILARIEDLRTGAVAEAELGEQPCAVTLRPGVAHAFRNMGGGDVWMLSWSDRAYDPADVERHMLIET